MSEETPLECLSRLGTNGVLWAREFNKTAVRLGYSEMDEEWLAGWFANAIENCDVIRCNPLRAENEKLTVALTEEYERGFTDCLKRVEELEREQAERQKERMKPIKDALYPGIYKPHRFKGD